MRASVALLLAASAAMLAGCGGNRACQEPQRYESAVEGRRIVAPEGLDDLAPEKELYVPKPSPVPPQPGPPPCLELPPAYQKKDG